MTPLFSDWKIREIKKRPRERKRKKEKVPSSYPLPIRERRTLSENKEEINQTTTTKANDKSRRLLGILIFPFWRQARSQKKNAKEMPKYKKNALLALKGRASKGQMKIGKRTIKAQKIKKEINSQFICFCVFVSICFILYNKRKDKKA